MSSTRAEKAAETDIDSRQRQPKEKMKMEYMEMTALKKGNALSQGQRKKETSEEEYHCKAQKFKDAK